MTDPTCTIKTETARVYKLRPDTGCGWADVTIREWPRGGSIDVQSDYGNFANTWTSVGDRPFRAFLCGIGFDYFMCKAAPDYLRFDAKETARRVKSMILEDRKSGNQTAADARELFDQLDDIENCTSEVEYYTVFYDGFGRLCDGCDAPCVHSPSAQSVVFWRHVWPAVTAFWRDELAAANDNGKAVAA